MLFRSFPAPKLLFIFQYFLSKFFIFQSFNYEITRFLISGIVFLIAYNLHIKFSFAKNKKVGVAIYLDNSLGNDQQLILCDTNQDDIIDIDDIVLLISWILGIDNSHLNGNNNLSFFQESNSLIINPGENIAAIEIKFEEKVENNNDYNIPSGWI